jgi:ATP-dependent Clp protease adaptor protein ClpS
MSAPTMDAGPATLEPETIEKVKEDKKEESAGTKQPAWEVRLFNDPFNKREFVAMCLATICGKNDTESYQIMMQAHQNGMGIIGRYDYEIAELYNKSLRDNGLMVDMIPVDDE